MLIRLWYGCITKQDIEMLKGLLVKCTNDPGATNFDTERWNKMSLVTPQHRDRVCRVWNEMALQKHCHKTWGRIYIYGAEDTVKGAELDLAEEYAMALWSSQRTKSSKKWNTKSDLPEMVSFAIGAHVMVFQKINTDLDLGVRPGARNGSWTDVSRMSRT